MIDIMPKGMDDRSAEEVRLDEVLADTHYMSIRNDIKLLNEYYQQLGEEPLRIDE